MKCSSKPNCVSSSQQPENRKYVEPLSYSISPIALKDIIRQMFRGNRSYTIVKEGEYYFHYEFRSTVFQFVDDVEILIRPQDFTIHFRSASRVGYWDLGANRRRINTIKKHLRKKIGER
ncbi:MAG: DUF1499 domain-containing protein [Bdellovibrionota bacterium]